LNKVLQNKTKGKNVGSAFVTPINEHFTSLSGRSNCTLCKKLCSKNARNFPYAGSKGFLKLSFILKTFEKFLVRFEIYENFKKLLGIKSIYKRRSNWFSKQKR
jgi:hypothetical protein